MTDDPDMTNSGLHVYLMWHCSPGEGKQPPDDLIDQRVSFESRTSVPIEGNAAAYVLGKIAYAHPLKYGDIFSYELCPWAELERAKYSLWVDMTLDRFCYPSWDQIATEQLERWALFEGSILASTVLILRQSGISIADLIAEFTEETK